MEAEMIKTNISYIELAINVEKYIYDKFKLPRHIHTAMFFEAIGEFNVEYQGCYVYSSRCSRCGYKADSSFYDHRRNEAAISDLFCEYCAQSLLTPIDPDDYFIF